MADVNVRSDSVDVEQIMRQIRARVREKRGADYTEAELQQLAQVKLEKFLDPRGVRSDLLEQFRSRPANPSAPNFEFEEGTLYETHRGALRTLRRLFRPILKLFFNPDRITTALHIQSQVNAQAERRLRHLEEPLWFELLHNLTVEITRLGIEVQNLKMRVESLSSRVDFDERRARALETVVQYRPASPRPASAESGGEASGAAPQPAPGVAPSKSPQPATPGDPAAGEPRRRRRRRRRRRPGQTMAESAQGGGWQPREANGDADGQPEDAAADADASASSDGPFEDDGPDGPDDPNQ
jgi:hypothetical protein